MRYIVTIPIAGHKYVNVDADSIEEAIEKAKESDENDIEWGCLNSFIDGNVCNCPNPWTIEVEEDV